MEDYKILISELDDLKLVGMLLAKEQYKEEAIRAAEEEIKNRDLTESQIASLQEQYHHENQQLTLLHKVLYFLFSLSFVTWFIMRKYQRQGNIQMYKDAIVATKFGLIFYLFLYVWFFILPDFRVGYIIRIKISELVLF